MYMVAMRVGVGVVIRVGVVVGVNVAVGGFHVVGGGDAGGLVEDDEDRAGVEFVEDESVGGADRT